MKYFSTILLALLAFTAVCAQTDSLPTTVIDGQPVYKYEVQKSEGLYRISKRFGVSQETLLKFNKSLENEGLKLGQIIFVPIVQTVDSSQYVLHTLQPKETLYGLSRMYDVKVEDIEKLNPETSKRMAIGSTLLIKKKESAEVATATKPQEAVEPAKISETASQAKTEDPKVAAPTTPEATVAAAVTDVRKIVEEAKENTEPVVVSTPAENDFPEDSLNTVISPLPLRLAFLLPFITDAVKRDATIDRFVDFYEGALIAIYEAQAKGQKFDIYTYDVAKTDLAVQQVLGRGELQMADAIIGPAYPAQVSYATLFAKQNRIPLLIPFTQKVNGVEHTPTLLQFNPGPEMAAQALVNHLMPQKDNVRFVLVDSKERDIPQSVSAVHQAVREAGFDITETTLKEILNDSLTLALDSEKENIIVFNSEKYSSLQVVMPSLLNQKKGNRLTVFGHYAWSDEKTLLPIIYTSVFHPADSVRTEHFDELYKHYFGRTLSNTHPRFDLLGYDLTSALIYQLQHCSEAATGQQEDDCFSTTLHGLQSDISYRRVAENGGRVNSAIQVLRKN